MGRAGDAPSARERLAVRLIGALGLAAGVAILVVLFRDHPDDVSFAPVCTWHTATGLRCPGCGLTRALHLAMHLQFREALSINPLIVLVPPIGLGAAAYLAGAVRRGRLPVLPAIPWAVLWGVAALVMGQFLYRTVVDLWALRGW